MSLAGILPVEPAGLITMHPLPKKTDPVWVYFFVWVSSAAKFFPKKLDFVGDIKTWP